MATMEAELMLVTGETLTPREYGQARPGAQLCEPTPRTALVDGMDHDRRGRRRRHVR